jgi:hypothetical protein
VFFLIDRWLIERAIDLLAMADASKTARVSGKKGNTEGNSDMMLFNL